MGIISSVICEEYQELMHGKSNYINVGNTFYIDEVSVFDLVVQWFGEKEIVLERILLIDPDDNIISVIEDEKLIEGFQETVIEYDLEFKTEGIHWICIFDNDKLLNKVAIIIENGE